ncbi:MAG: hypothetical protein GY943_12230 [Chloroflexi bacterium]|nr:hypothetical protein [Chloroflexota bacterium]
MDIGERAFQNHIVNHIKSTPSAIANATVTNHAMALITTLPTALIMNC